MYEAGTRVVLKETSDWMPRRIATVAEDKGTIVQVLVDPEYKITLGGWQDVTPDQIEGTVEGRYAFNVYDSDHKVVGGVLTSNGKYTNQAEALVGEAAWWLARRVDVTLEATSVGQYLLDAAGIMEVYKGG